jgi:hypothetical protein
MSKLLEGLKSPSDVKFKSLRTTLESANADRALQDSGYREMIKGIATSIVVEAVTNPDLCYSDLTFAFVVARGMNTNNDANLNKICANLQERMNQFN